MYKLTESVLALIVGLSTPFLLPYYIIKKTQLYQLLDNIHQKTVAVSYLDLLLCELPGFAAL